MPKFQYEYPKVISCLKKIFGCAVGNGNALLSIAFLIVIPLQFIAEYIEIDNVKYQVSLFKGIEGATIKGFCIRTCKGLALKLVSSIVLDISTAEIFYTGLEKSLAEYMSMSWSTYHKYSLGELLTLQYEKGQSVSKFLFELFVSIIINIYKTVALIVVIAESTHSAIGSAFTAAAFAHVLIFFLLFKTYNTLQIKFLDSKSKARALVESESKNFSVVKAYGLEEKSTKRIAEAMENRYHHHMKFNVFDSKSNLIYKFFEVFSLMFLYSFYYADLIPATMLNSVCKQVVMLYESMRALIQAMSALRKEFHLFYTLEEQLDHKGSPTKWVNAFTELKCTNVTVNGVFAPVSITIEPFKKIAVVGSNGSGKTVFLRTLSGLVPSDGAVSINGDEIESISPKDVHKLITFISQAEAYTQGTVMENLQYGNSLSRSEVIEKCKIFEVDSVFQGLNGGYDKFSSSLGTDLSGGQKQRVSFMRGVLRTSPVLIVDDCLTGVNTTDRNSLTDKLISLDDRCLVMTCDKLEKLKRFDQIVLLGKETSKVGTFSELKSDLVAHFN